MADKKLICKSCNRQFIFTDGEQKFYAEKGFRQPANCKKCRDKKKNVPSSNVKKTVNSAKQYIMQQKNVPTKRKPVSRAVPQIDVEEIYHLLKKLIDLRYEQELEQNRYWDNVKRGYNQEQEMNDVNGRIGKTNNQINLLISELIKHKNQHSSYKLALDHLYKEKERVTKIYNKWDKTIYDVDYRGGSLINASGETHYDTSNAKIYRQKQQVKYSNIVDKINKLERLDRE